METTINVEIKYLASLRDRTGRRREAATFGPGTTLQDVAGWLNDQYGLPLPGPQVMATLNGQGWTQLPSQLSTRLDEGDVICLFPPVSGG